MYSNDHVEKIIGYYAKEDAGVAYLLVELLRLRERWIPVEVRLPEEDGDYMAWDNKRKAVINMHVEKSDTSINDSFRNITHWMPYPASPYALKESLALPSFMDVMEEMRNE
jgi:hypothetical protein